MATTWQATAWVRVSDSDVVAQASGMVSVQARCNVTDAVVIMRETATDTDCTVEEIATMVIEREIHFRE